MRRLKAVLQAVLLLPLKVAYISSPRSRTLRFGGGCIPSRFLRWRTTDHLSIDGINLVKPGIGEAARVLLLRLPWKVLVHSLDDYEYLGHLYQLSQEKDVVVEEYPLVNYRACGLIRKLADT